MNPITEGIKTFVKYTSHQGKTAYIPAIVKEFKTDEFKQLAKIGKAWGQTGDSQNRFFGVITSQSLTRYANRIEASGLYINEKLIGLLLLSKDGLGKTVELIWKNPALDQCSGQFRDITKVLLGEKISTGPKLTELNWKSAGADRKSQFEHFLKQAINENPHKKWLGFFRKITDAQIAKLKTAYEQFKSGIQPSQDLAAEANTALKNLPNF